MSRTFHFRESQNILQVDPKTFSKWLKKEGIDPKKQVNAADRRQKWLTEEQILRLARSHGREVHFPPLDQEDEQEPPAAVILTIVDERLTALEQLITQRFDQVEELFDWVEAQLRTVIADLQHDLVQPEPTLSPPREQVKAVRPRRRQPRPGPQPGSQRRRQRVRADGDQTEGPKVPTFLSSTGCTSRHF